MKDQFSSLEVLNIIKEVFPKAKMDLALMNYYKRNKLISVLPVENKRKSPKIFTYSDLFNMLLIIKFRELGVPAKSKFFRNLL